jgi:hypothetical protein
MSNFIFSPKSNSDVEMFYCLRGKEDFIDDDGNSRVESQDSDNIAAKCTQNKKPKSFSNNEYQYSYYIRTTPNSSLFNPIELLSPIKNKREFDFIDGVCKNKWMFKEVSKITFDKYLKFLNTKMVSWLKDAERDLK